MSDPASTSELMACELALRLRDGETAIIGGASPVPMAAVLLAQRTRAPNVTLLTGSGAVNPRPKQLAPSSGDFAYSGTAEAFFTMEDVFDDTELGRWDVGIFGGLQIDRYGNFNLTYVGGTLEAPRLRGPGLVNAGLPMSLGRTMLCAERHTPDVFVAAIDFASGAGTRRRDGSPYTPTRRGVGPDFCVTALASLDFSGAEDQLSLLSVHPGADGEEVQAMTGFPLAGPADPPTTAAPAEDLIEALREIDSTGLLRERKVSA